MKFRKLILADALIVPITTICPLLVATSCNKEEVPFEVYTEKDVTSKNINIDVPMTFSYSPKTNVEISLVNTGTDISDIKLARTSIKVVNNKATVQFVIKEELWESKNFDFDIKFIYDDLSPAFILEGMHIHYIFEFPEDKIKINLVGQKDVYTKNEKTNYSYLIQFSKCPIDSSSYISLKNLYRSDDRVEVTSANTAEVVEDQEGKYFLEFNIDFSNITSLELGVFYTSFDLALSFANPLGTQDETIVGCSITYTKN